MHCDVDAGMAGGKAVASGRVLFPKMLNGIRRVFERLDIEADLSGVEVLPSERHQGSRYALIQWPDCDVHRTPDAQSERVSSSLYGDPVHILAREGDWRFTQSIAGYLGWIESSGLKEVDLETWRDWHRGSRAYFQREVRADETAIPVGAALPRVNENHVRLVDGDIREVSRDAFRCFETANSASRQTAVEVAERYLGVVYRWGGRGADGIDCSGFMQTIYRHLGITLARDANQQILAGTLAATRDWRSELLPGDLLFFTNDIGKISHVGLSAGGSRFIHASSNRGVAFNSLDPGSDIFSEQLSERFVLAKRILI